LLPHTGLTGWLQLGLGATGFGAGLWGSSHAFREDKERTGFGNNPEVQRYFEPALLHTVERSVHDVLSADPAYTMCDCPSCPALQDGSWNHRAAKLHQLHWLGRLAAVVGLAVCADGGAVLYLTVREIDHWFFTDDGSDPCELAVHADPDADEAQLLAVRKLLNREERQRWIAQFSMLSYLD
jgi:hypothetical protein